MRRVIGLLVLLILLSNALKGTFLGGMAGGLFNVILDLVSPIMPLIIMVFGIKLLFDSLF